MAFLASLIGLSLAALPVVEESVTRATPALTAGAGFERFSVVSIPVPSRPSQHSLHRLRVASPYVWLDGARLTPNEEGDFDLLNLNPTRPSRVTVPGWIGQAVIVETPRVFVSRHEISARSARLWVRNSLENLVNVYATVTGANGIVWEQSATVPPGSTQLVTLSGAAAGSATPPWQIGLEKQEEAMEGAYRFVKTTTQSAGPTVNTSMNP